MSRKLKSSSVFDKVANSSQETIALVEIVNLVINNSFKSLKRTGGDEGVTSLSEDLHQVVSKIATSKIHTSYGVWKGITFINWDVVGDTITRIKDNT